MPIPIRANQAHLIVDGTTHELRDLYIRTDDTIERQNVMGSTGRSRGVVTSRVIIEADVMPELLWRSEPRQPMQGRRESDDELHERIVDTFWQAPLETARGPALDAIAATFGMQRQPSGQRQALAELTELVLSEPGMPTVYDAPPTMPAVPSPTKPEKPAPEPRAWLELLLDDSFELC